MGTEIKIDDPGDMGPAELGNIGDRVFVASQIRMFSQSTVQRGKGLICQAAVTRNGIGIFVRGKQFEINPLAHDRPHAGGVKHQPLNGLPTCLGRDW